MKRLSLIAALILSPLSGVAAQEPAEPVEVMILGVYHFANPGRDVVNIEVDDVTTPQRQAELEALSAALAEWRPTRILVERESAGPDFIDENYRSFTPAMLAENRNETVQIGYRLAHRLGHENVYGFDEQGGEGEPDYFPFGRVRQWADDHGAGERLDAIFDEVRAMAEREQERQATQSIARSLIVHNSPQNDEMHRRTYYGMLQFGDADDQPGAEINAYWYMRNAKMFAKLGLIAEPGDRVLVIVGSGHGYWLRQLAREAPGYDLVPVMPYLERAAD